MRTILATAIAVAAVSAKDHFVVKPEVHRMESHKRPDVQAYNCQTCLADKDNTKACLTYGANLKVGWEWDQEWYDDPLTPNIKDGYYDIELKWFTEQGFATSIWLLLDRVFDLETDFEFEEFDLGVTFGFKYWRASKRSCFTVYRFIDNFLLDLTMSMRFPECYKDIISSLWCFDNWTGVDAKIIDKCEFSSEEPIEMYRYEIEQDDAQKYWVGSDEDKSEGCWPNFIGGSSTSSQLFVNMLDNFYMYAFDALELGPDYQ
jgi:hypothetical protein